MTQMWKEGNPQGYINSSVWKVTKQEKFKSTRRGKSLEYYHKFKRNYKGNLLKIQTETLSKLILSQQKLGFLCNGLGNRKFWKEKEQDTHTHFVSGVPAVASTFRSVARKRSYNWSVKAIRRKTTRTGRIRYLRHLPRRIKSGFREGTEAALKKKGATAATSA
ncbi:60S ribosomal protein L37, putative [Ricinus communis]|uniref:60S ribosomal protein L37, putative n=1 Tax=Ricinus communis TaxID=3988 RepID=B9RII7_RICCO|nr:60S ribosomal protein L37, putative [Ricinus communis]